MKTQIPFFALFALITTAARLPMQTTATTPKSRKPWSLLLILLLLSQLPTWAQTGNPAKAWSRSIFFSSFRDYDASFGWYVVYFTTADGSTAYFPLNYTNSQGAMSFSQEMRQRGTSSFFDTDYAVWSEFYGIWSQFGSMSLYMPVNDNNGNGIPDWLERENSANELVTGSYSIDWPTTGSYIPTALLTRSAGSLNGNYTLRVGSGPTTSGTWTVQRITGSVSFNRTEGTATISVSNDANGITLTGSAAFTVQNDNQTTIGVVTLTGGGYSYHTTGNTVFTRTGNRYLATIFFADGFTDSPWADFTSWAVEITDTTAPTATITLPTSNPSYLTNATTINLSGTAADDIGVTQVRWSNNRGGSGIASGTALWSVSGISLLSGTNVITVTAYDAAGNTRSHTLAVILDTTKPTVSITNPPSAKTYTNPQPVTVSATASDNIGVASVEFYEGATLKGTDTTAPYTFDWPFTAADNGVRVWTARAYDAAGNVSTSSPVTLTVSIDITPPTVVISSPANGANLTTATSTASGTASDPGSPSSGLNRVEVRVNSGNWSNATGTASWSRSVTLLPCGNTIEVRSRDNAGNYSAIASNYVTFTPPSTLPNTPTNISPVAGARNVSATPTLQASPFTDPDLACLGDVHAASQWQVLNRPGAVVVADSGTDTVNRVSWTIPSGKLYYGSNYQWQVRYRDSRNGWSSYSTRTFFTNSGPMLIGINRGTNIVLNWPTNSAGFALQWSTNFVYANWSNAAPAPVIVNGQYAVTNNMTNTFRFYRLKK